MKVYDFVVVGGGIGGTLTSVMLSELNYKTLLVEKESYLGGCSGTFERDNVRYNIGATTFSDLGKNKNSQTLFANLFQELNLVKLEIPITIIQNGKKIFRYSNIDVFIKHIQTIYPGFNHDRFWRDIYSISLLFYSNNDLYYNKSNFIELLKSLLKLVTTSFPFLSLILKNAKLGLDEYFPDIDKEFYNFLENQFLIVAQTKIEKANFLTLALALSYPFFDNYYAVGGMGEIFSKMEQKIDEVKKNTIFEACYKKDDLFYLKTSKGEVVGKKVIFNTQYKNDFIKKNDLQQSAFVVYGLINTNEKFEHHYQILAKNILKNTISNSIFVSFSDRNDRKMAPENNLSFTISIHTKVSFWDNLDKTSYKIQKSELTDEIVTLLCDSLNINRSQLEKVFSATPLTFQRYLGRSVLGGMPLEAKNFLFKFGSPKIGDYYYCGDNVFPAQGWPGVVSGVENLKKVLRV